MKTLKDGTQVSSRLWYYLLDFLSDAQRDGNFLGVSVRELDKEGFSQLFFEATHIDLERI